MTDWARVIENKYNREHSLVNLIGVGAHPAIAASDLKIGDTIVYNYGSTGKVTAIEPTGRVSLNVTVLARDGKEYTQRKRRDTLVPVDRPKRS